MHLRVPGGVAITSSFLIGIVTNIIYVAWSSPVYQATAVEVDAKEVSRTCDYVFLLCCECWQSRIVESL